jgi:predicted NUDIX family NTP pyrophosphohydrolase
MPKRSAGILMFRQTDRGTEVLLVHPGGPFWRNKDSGAWSIPKGEYGGAEEAESVARREFLEETGAPATARLQPLGTLRQPSGKIVSGFAMEGDFDVDALQSNSFELEWPPHSGRTQSFPEVDRARWFTVEEARIAILPGQAPFLSELLQLLGNSPLPPAPARA